LIDHLWKDSDPVAEARKLVTLAVKLYKPVAVWALCSGGNDSLCSTHVAMSTGLVTGVASIDTTIGIRQTREHLTKVAERFKWPLKWLVPPVSYRELCARFGMPGPSGHNLVYQRLKERCIRQLVRESKRRTKDKVLLVTGCRASESVRRMANSDPMQREGGRVWVAPIINWDDTHKTVYQVDNGLPRNPVTATLGISGECLCGAFAKPGERAKIAANFPEAEAEIRACEAAAAENCQPSAWGERPKARKPDNEYADRRAAEEEFQHLCQQCDRKNEAA
jgi:3'-phosphoadenosine 5'-phosphosulfate sulfotransferase (PAPS reductase)/FAD synthetase